MAMPRIDLTFKNALNYLATLPLNLFRPEYKKNLDEFIKDANQVKESYSNIGEVADIPALDKLLKLCDLLAANDFDAINKYFTKIIPFETPLNPQEKAVAEQGWLTLQSLMTFKQVTFPFERIYDYAFRSQKERDLCMVSNVYRATDEMLKLFKLITHDQYSAMQKTYELPAQNELIECYQQQKNNSEKLRNTLNPKEENDHDDHMIKIERIPYGFNYS